MKKVRKCKKCQGKGFILGKNYIIKEGSFGYEMQDNKSILSIVNERGNHEQGSHNKN